MKKLIFLGLFLLSTLLQAQERTPEKYHNSLKFAPFRMIGNTLAIGYEHKFSDAYALSALSQFIYKEQKADYQIGFVQDIGWKMLTPPTLEFYGISPFMYFMPYAQFGTFNFRDATFDNKPSGESELQVKEQLQFNMYGGGLLVGMGFDIGKKFYLQAYFGGGIKANTLSNDPHSYYGFNDIWVSKGMLPKGGFELGFKF